MAVCCHCHWSVATQTPLHSGGPRRACFATTTTVKQEANEQSKVSVTKNHDNKTMTERGNKDARQFYVRNSIMTTAIALALYQEFSRAQDRYLLCTIPVNCRVYYARLP